MVTWLYDHSTVECDFFAWGRSKSLASWWWGGGRDDDDDVTTHKFDDITYFRPDFFFFTGMKMSFASSTWQIFTYIGGSGDVDWMTWAYCVMKSLAYRPLYCMASFVVMDDHRQVSTLWSLLALLCNVKPCIDHAKTTWLSFSNGPSDQTFDRYCFT